MPNLKVKNLDVKFSNQLTKQQVKEAIERGFAGVDPTAETVYLIKINVGNMRMDAVAHLAKALTQDLKQQGITNFIFIPLCDNGIQDIEVIEVPNERA
jgi:glycerate kinase